MPFKTFHIITALTVLPISCHQNNVEYETIQVPLNSATAPNQSFKIEKIISLETSDSSIVGRVNRIRITESNIYILDRDFRQSLLLFDAQGKFINHIKKGKGPGESVYPNDYYINQKNRIIEVYDVSLKQVNHYDYNLNPLKSVECPIFLRNFVRLDNGNWLVHNQSDDTGAKLEIFSYAEYNSKLELIKPYLADQFDHHSLIVVNPISREGGSPIFCRPFDQHLYGFNITHEVVKKYFLDFGRLNLLHSDIDQGIQHVYKLMLAGEKVTILGDIINNEQYVGCSFVYRGQSEFVIYSKETKESICSLNLQDHLPVGELKGMVDEDTFILMVSQEELSYFEANSDIVIPQHDPIDTGGNDFIILFSIG